MPIPESQLDTWSSQGSVTQSQTTYGTIRAALEPKDSPYAAKSCEIFLQGSYGNDTNIFADSDVDVVIKTDGIYYEDTSNLNPTDLAIYKSTWTAGKYSYQDFKNEVTTQLTKKFGSSVKPGTKAIFVERNGSRRDADVLPAAQYRKYLSFQSSASQSYVEGICFWAADGTQIINYPALHSANCTVKHQGANSWFKPTVRILKNMRNTMVAKGYLTEGVAPSYFLEGMLYNVPTNLFGQSYQDTVVKAINWLVETDQTKLVCANEQYYLCHPSSPVTWRSESLKAYLNAAVKFWVES